jgi:pectate lyase
VIPRSELSANSRQFDRRTREAPNCATLVLASAALLAGWPLVIRAADGWAGQNGDTTGGSSGSIVAASELASFRAAASDDAARVIHVSGTIDLGTSNVRVGANKTIIGLGVHSGFTGNLQVRDSKNVILQNLNFTNPKSVASGDGLTLQNAQNVWVDHCAFVQCGDGSLDITHGSNFITVSWCKFHYTSNSGHNFANLIGHSDNNAAEDTGKLRVTLHHNWWSTLCVERMPRVRFGRIHSFNNYFNCSGNNYCVRASIQSEVRAEHNYFENIKSPYAKYASGSSTGRQVGRIHATGDVMVNCSEVVAFTDEVFAPPYSYMLQSPSAARSAIIDADKGAGPH